MNESFVFYNHTLKFSYKYKFWDFKDGFDVNDLQW